MHKPTALALSATLATVAAPAAFAHYGMILPSDNMVAQDEPRTLNLDIAFAHPFEQDGMTLVKPKAFSVTTADGTTDLLSELTDTKFLDEQAWSLDYTVARPGTYVFAMEPQPYWEPAEDAFIIHYTKTYVTAFGVDEGWDTELGLKTEIVPLSKPFGLWEGNVFQGQVLMDGEPVPHAEVEIEYYNEDAAVEAPSDIMVTQTIKADANGVFTYATPESGWWGFAALNTADYTLEMDGEEKAVELGAVIWVHFEPWTTR